MNSNTKLKKRGQSLTQLTAGRAYCIRRHRKCL